MKQWTREPIVVPRSLLTLKYALFILFGASVLWASAPSLNQFTPDGYTGYWASFVSIASIVCLIGSTSNKRPYESIERWGALVLASLLVIYAFSPIILVLNGDSDRAAFSVAALIVSILPTARALALIRRTGIPSSEPN